MSKVIKIVLSGGPCAGKSSGISLVEEKLIERGYKVLVVPESATELINGGISPKSVGLIEFQKCILTLQKAKEKIYTQEANLLAQQSKKGCVIIFDRGTIDGEAFVEEKEFKEVLNELEYKKVHLRDYYDYVFHLESAANNAEEFYTLDNNRARSETIEEARVIDENIIKAWSGHPHFRIIRNKGLGFEAKMQELMKEVLAAIGDPIQYEIEHSFLIEMPNFNILSEKYHAHKTQIIQTYLKGEGERRVRQRGDNNVYSFYYTEKIGKGEKRIEKERKISKEEYLNCLLEADINLHQIRKDRYCFIYDDFYLEIDVYPNNKDYAILEVEMKDEKEIERLKFPPEIKVIKKVHHSNYELAKRK